jgi:hypothetical protein
MEDFAIKDELLAKIERVLHPINVRTKRWASFSLLTRTRQDRQNELERLSGLIAHLALIGQRKGSERCLKCGSVDVARFDGTYSKPNSYASKGTTVNTGFCHPGCGGEFLASVNPVRLNLIFEPRLYSVEGHELIVKLEVSITRCNSSHLI